MECLRCGYSMKDNALVCPKCGFIMKGAQKIDNPEPTMTFEEKINAASAEELRALILAYKKMKDAPAKDSVAPEVKAAKKAKTWALICFISGLLSLILMIIPGINVVASLVLFLLAFIGFGKSAGYRPKMALAGVLMSVIAIAGSWAYNAFFAESIGKSLGLLKEVKPAVDAAADAAAGTVDVASQVVA